VSLGVRRLGLAGALALLIPVLASAQVAIEHQDVACMVAGQFPVLDACFRPGPDLAKARVYFRPEGVPNWYYVEASSAAPPKTTDPADLLCRRATLPKPKKSLLQKHVEYYVEATGRKLESIQTETYRPLVVKSQGECKSKLVAPFVPNAVVQVFPSLPAAFAAGGGLSTAAVVAVVGGGVAAGTAGVVAATNGGGGSNPTPTTAPPATVPPTTAPPVTLPPTTATTTQPVAFNPVFMVFNNGVLDPSLKIAGTEPLSLRFYMCDSTGPKMPLKFNVLVNGTIVTAGCDTTIKFTTVGYSATFGAVVASSGPVRASAASYNVEMRIQSDLPGNNPKASQTRTVDVSSGCRADTTGPTNVGLATPKPGDSFASDGPVNFTSFPTDPSGIDRVEYWLTPPPSFGPPTFKLGQSSSPPNYLLTQTDFSTVTSCSTTTVDVFAIAFDTCGNFTQSGNVTINLGPIAACSASPPRVEELSRPGPTNAPRRDSSLLVSDLEMAGSRGQVILNGSDALFPNAGRVHLAARLRAGENRVEAQLVQAEGRAGLWRFELGSEGLVSGSLRVLAGEVALVTGDAVVFRLKGQAGERVVFTFRR
jgi:hypothetical protein